MRTNGKLWTALLGHGARALALLVLAVAAGPACVDREDHHVAGSDLYAQYCSACHGSAGKGDGPLAASLRRAPADLTQIAARNGGKFDEAALMSVIDGRRAVAEHGPREMPVWGARFEDELKGEPMQTYVGLLQTRSLVDYLRSLQAKP
jgi:mono/diheme cytochrome c family protein